MTAEHTKAESGFVLLLFALLGVALSLLLTLEFGMSQLSLVGIQADANALRARNIASEQLYSELNRIAGPIALANDTRTPLAPGLELVRSIAFVGRSAGTEEAVISTAFGRYPDWNYLSKTAPPVPCSRWASSSESGMRHNYSALSCVSLPATLASSFYVRGNLESAQALSFNIKSSEPVRLAVAGKIKLDAPLNAVTDGGTKRLELIAFGDLELSTVSVTGGNLELLLYSAQGQIKISEAFSPAMLCQNSNPEVLRISLNASRISIGASSFPGPRLGCTLSVDKLAWPDLKVLR